MGGAEWDERIERALDGGQPGSRARSLGKYPHQLSGGQLQRLLIARALLLDIELLVADEIISMLDASTRIDVLNLLADLKARGLGVLFITHDLSLGNYISERTVVLRRGAVVEMGLTDKVFGDPLHPYTQATAVGRTPAAGALAGGRAGHRLPLPRKGGEWPPPGGRARSPGGLRTARRLPRGRRLIGRFFAVPPVAVTERAEACGSASVTIARVLDRFGEQADTPLYS